MKTRHYTYKGTEVALEWTSYACDGTLAVRLNRSSDGEPYAMVTVNLSHPLQSRTMAFVDENNLPGIGKWLSENGIAFPMGLRQQSGFCSYELYTFLRHE